MKFSKKIWAIGVAAVLTLSLVACGSSDSGTVTQPENTTQPETTASATPATSETPSAAAEPAEEKDFVDMTQDELMGLYPDPTPSGTVTIGSSTQMNADFMWGFTNISPNADIKRMLFYDYRLVVSDMNEEFLVNPVVVKDWDAVNNSDGTKTYTFEIYDNLVYNDGSPISAVDYIFTYMLMSSPEFASLDGSATYGTSFVGYNSFNLGYMVNEDELAVDASGNVIETKENGESVFSGDKVLTKTFEGLHLIDKYKLSFTIKAEELPFFYELAFFDTTYPLPMHVIAPGCDLTDDGSGATMSEGFTDELVYETIMTSNGYRYKPMVTPGCYQFVSYDDTQFTAIIEANPNFLCLFDGVKPRIQRIISKRSPQSTQMNELETGAVDILQGVSTGSTIDSGFELVDRGIVEYTSYPRNGYGKIAFHCDFGPTQFEAVRQAVTYLLDRDEFGRQYSGGYAIVVDSRYSEAQWTYQARKEELEEKLVSYTLDTDKAREVLIADGWVLDANGNDYVEGAGNIRYKMVDGELMGLVIQWCSSADNAVSDLLAIMLPPEAEKVGMKIEQTVQDSVLDTYYRRGVDEPFFHMFNMGTGFGNPDSPWYDYSTDPRYFNGVWNNNFIREKDLEDITWSMKLTDPEDRESFLDKWVDYQVIWNRTLPDVPLYANIYHDFYQPRLKDYVTNSVWYLCYTLPRAYVED